jgi:adenosylcobinamide amidohydrolase
MIFESVLGDKIHKYNKSIVIRFHGKRNVLSTSHINGGYREDLTAVFNNDCTLGAGMGCQLKAAAYEEHLKIVAEELGLDSGRTAGLGTAASMDNVSIKVEEYKGLAVTAIVTGGIEINGGRVGDPASFDERDIDLQNEHGTINIILLINSFLEEHTMTRAVVTCTEAKTAAIQELMAGSNYSSGIATGSGTDGTIVISDMESPVKLTNAGKHSKLGELIGKCVKKAVKEALYKQTGLSPEFQYSVFNRFKRYGLTEETVWKNYLQQITNENEMDKLDFIHNLHKLDSEKVLITYGSLYLHLLDQLQWNLLKEEEVINAARTLLNTIRKELNLKEEDSTESKIDKEDIIKLLITDFEKLIINIVKNL